MEGLLLVGRRFRPPSVALVLTGEPDSQLRAALESSDSRVGTQQPDSHARVPGPHCQHRPRHLWTAGLGSAARLARARACVWRGREGAGKETGRLPSGSHWKAWARPLERGSWRRGCLSRPVWGQRQGGPEGLEQPGPGALESAEPAGSLLPRLATRGEGPGEGGGSQLSPVCGGAGHCEHVCRAVTLTTSRVLEWATERY